MKTEHACIISTTGIAISAANATDEGKEIGPGKNDQAGDTGSNVDEDGNNDDNTMVEYDALIDTIIETFLLSPDELKLSWKPVINFIVYY